MEPRDHLFRKMIALSGVFHALMFVAGVFWLSLSAPPLRIAPVAVVDLVGGERMSAPEAAPSSPPAAAPARKSAGKKAPPARQEKLKERTAKREAAKPKEISPSESREFSERIRKMREERASKTHVREAVETIQREKAVRAAVRGIGERVAHRVDLSAMRASKAAAARAAAGLPGAAGTARVAPEILAYARALDEKVRANWTVPELAQKVAKSLMVQVRITIEKDGKVSNVRMEKVSGNSYFDDSVERAIRKASPLPVPPEQLRGGEDHYEVGFRFYGGDEA